MTLHPLLPANEAERVGLEEMQLSSIDDLRSMIYTWSIRCPNSVMFRKKRNGHHLLTMAMPLSDLQYELFRNGKVDDIEVAQYNVPVRSKNILLEVLAGETRVPSQGARAKSQIELMSMLMMQIASISLPVPTHGLNLLSLEGTDTSTKRLKKWGFSPVPACFPRCDRRIVEMQLGRAPSIRSPLSNIVYGMILVYQALDGISSAKRA